MTILGVSGVVTLVALVALAWSRGRGRGGGREEREVSRGRGEREMTQLSEEGLRVCERGKTKRGEEKGQQGRQELEPSSLDGSETEQMKT